MPDLDDRLDAWDHQTRHDPEAIVRAAIQGATMTRRPFAYATSFLIEELAVTAPDGTHRSYLAKQLGRGALSVQARRAKSGDLPCPGRELLVYRDLLAGLDLGTPGFVGGSFDDEDGVLVIERVDGAPLTEIGDFTAWTAAAAWLARAHARLGAAARGTDGRTPGWLLRYDEALLDERGRRGTFRAERLGLGSTGDRAALGFHLDRALESFRCAAPTVVHGDLYPSNVLIAGSRIAVVDWELAGIGPALCDLAALSSGRWTAERRRALAMAYRDEAAHWGDVDDMDTFLARLDLAALHVALCWLGSSSEWEPPAEHRHDWFATALSVVRRLEAVRT